RRRCLPAAGGTVLRPPLPRTSAAGVALRQLAAGPPTGRGALAVVEHRGLRPALATHRGGETRRCRRTLLRLLPPRRPAAGGRDRQPDRRHRHQRPASGHLTATRRPVATERGRALARAHRSPPAAGRPP